MKLLNKILAGAFCFAAISAVQSQVTFTIDNANTSGNTVTESVMSGGDTYVLTATHSVGGATAQLSPGPDSKFYATGFFPSTQNWTVTVTRNGSPINFDVDQVVYDNPNGGDYAYALYNDANVLIGNTLASFLSTNPMAITNAAAAQDVSSFDIRTTIGQGTSQVYFHNIIINPVPSCTNSTASVLVSECETYTVPSGDETYTSSGTYMDTIPNAGGCDSIITLDVTILSPTTGTESITACDSFTWIDGNTYTASTNTPTFVTMNTAGCDSTITLDLTINTATAGINQVDALTLEATNVGATYSWWDCINQMDVPGETSQTFTATANGEYAVIVGENGCIDTSACIVINEVGLETETLNAVNIYPNPTNGTIQLNWENNVMGTIDIFAADGRLVLTETMEETTGKSLKLVAEPGVYTLRVRTQNGEIVEPIVLK